MSGMDKFLAEYYGTNQKTASADQEDLEKEASVELFMKLAGAQNIDLESMPDEQVQALYTSWVEKSAEMDRPKTASDDGDEDDKKDKKVREEAEKEHEEKKAASEKIAEADFLGRVMAHAYAQELRKIAASGGEAEEPAEPAEGAEKEAAMLEALRKGLDAARGGAKKVTDAIGGAASKVNQNRTGKAVKEHLRSNKGAYTAGAAAAAGGAAGAAVMHHKNKKKEASAIDMLAADYAVNLAHHRGFDAEEAGRKVAAVIELGLLGESEKVAAAESTDIAIGVRALEFLEVAGYPVTWDQ